MRAVAVFMLATFAAVPAFAQTTLVGRDGKAAVITNGERQEIDTRNLVVNRSGPFAPRPAAPKAAPPEAPQPTKAQPAADQPAKPGEQKPEKEDAKETKPAPGEKAKKQTPEEQEKAVAELTRKPDVARLRELQKQGAWFYTDGNVPLAPEEMEQRLQTGNVGDVKALNIHLQEWKTDSEPPKN